MGSSPHVSLTHEASFWGLWSPYVAAVVAARLAHSLSLAFGK